MVLGAHQSIKIIHVAEQEIAFDNHAPRVANQPKHSKTCNKKPLLVVLMVLISICVYMQLPVYLQEKLAIIEIENENTTSKMSDLSKKDKGVGERAVVQAQNSTIQSQLNSNDETQPSQKDTDEQQTTKTQQKQQKQQPKQQTPQPQIKQTPSKPLKNYPNRAISSYVYKRRQKYQQIIASFKKQDQQQLKTHLSFYHITNQQFYRVLVLSQNAPLDMPVTKNPIQTNLLSKLDQEQFRYYQNKYNISSYKELPMCIVVPTYKNYKRFRYFFNLHTITQQHYSNYHIIIIDDASKDEAVKALEQELKDQQLRQKVTFVRNQHREYHMANFYNGIHRYCKKGQILVTIDGDDELIGRYVFKVINAAYYRSRNLAIYSNHLQSKREVVFDIGISNNYPDQAKQNNSYRQKAHLYSHLRTTWVDLFLLIKQSDLKTNQGKWFTNAVDNAMFYPIFEMSCGEVEYLSQILYKYNTFTGQNVDNLPFWMRKQTNDEINSKTRYTCLKEWDRNTYDNIKSYISCIILSFHILLIKGNNHKSMLLNSRIGVDEFQQGCDEFKYVDDYE